MFNGSDHERVVVVHDAASGLRAIVAVHSTALGPAVGGLRMKPYPDLDAAVVDALRLSRAMSLKNACAGLGLGGGKAVIVDDGAVGRRSQRLLAFADALESLDGMYYTAEDVGTSPADMDLIASRTRYVLGVSPDNGGSGDPSPTTARTVLEAIREGVRSRLGRDGLDGVRVAIAGTGKVGSALAAGLAAEGAELVLADREHDRARALGEALGARVVAADRVLEEDVDVFAPCAMGEVIDAELAAELRCSVVAGAANNPLVDRDAAVALEANQILYVPDFLANCGGMITIAAEYRRAGGEFVEEAIAAAAARLRLVLEEARDTGRLPIDVALDHAQQVIGSWQRR